MARRGSKVLGVALVAFAAACYLRKPAAFVPGPLRQHAAPLAAASAATMFAPAAFADEIGDAAKKLGDGSYDFAKEVDWNNGLYLQAPGAFKPLEALRAIDKMIVMAPRPTPSCSRRQVRPTTRPSAASAAPTA
jgi:hypothetical protein